MMSEISTSDFTTHKTDELAALWAENSSVRIFMLEDHGTGIGCLTAANRIKESMALGYRITAVTGMPAPYNGGSRVLIFMTRNENE